MQGIFGCWQELEKQVNSYAEARVKAVENAWQRERERSAKEREALRKRVQHLEREVERWMALAQAQAQVQAQTQAQVAQAQAHTWPLSDWPPITEPLPFGAMGSSQTTHTPRLPLADPITFPPTIAPPIPLLSPPTEETVASIRTVPSPRPRPKLKRSLSIAMEDDFQDTVNNVSVNDTIDDIVVVEAIDDEIVYDTTNDTANDTGDDSSIPKSKASVSVSPVAAVVKMKEPSPMSTTPISDPTPPSSKRRAVAKVSDGSLESSDALWSQWAEGWLKSNELKWQVEDSGAVRQWSYWQLLKNLTTGPKSKHSCETAFESVARTIWNDLLTASTLSNKGVVTETDFTTLLATRLEVSKDRVYEWLYGFSSKPTQTRSSKIALTDDFVLQLPTNPLGTTDEEEEEEEEEDEVSSDDEEASDNDEYVEDSSSKLKKRSGRRTTDSGSKAGFNSEQRKCVELWLKKKKFKWRVGSRGLAHEWTYWTLLEHMSQVGRARMRSPFKGSGRSVWRRLRKDFKLETGSEMNRQHFENFVAQQFEMHRTTVHKWTDGKATGILLPESGVLQIAKKPALNKTRNHHYALRQSRSSA